MSSPRLAHNVFFKLKDSAAANVTALVDACHKYLNVQPGIVFFAAGVCSPELDRPVNDRDYDVALHLVFVDRAAHDAYQTDPTHDQFIQEQKAGWARVRVFDANV